MILLINEKDEVCFIKNLTYESYTLLSTAAGRTISNCNRLAYYLPTRHGGTLGTPSLGFPP